MNRVPFYAANWKMNKALSEIDRGRGVEAVRDLIRQTEKTISSMRGPAKMKSFQDKMSLVMQPKA